MQYHHRWAHAVTEHTGDGGEMEFSDTRASYRFPTPSIHGITHHPMQIANTDWPSTPSPCPNSPKLFHPRTRNIQIRHPLIRRQPLHPSSPLHPLASPSIPGKPPQNPPPPLRTSSHTPVPAASPPTTPSPPTSPPPPLDFPLSATPPPFPYWRVTAETPGRWSGVSCAACRRGGRGLSRGPWLWTGECGGRWGV